MYVWCLARQLKNITHKFSSACLLTLSSKSIVQKNNISISTSKNTMENLKGTELQNTLKVEKIQNVQK